MAHEKTQANKILFVVFIILSLVYLLSFTKSCSSDSRKLMKTALVNNKYISSINRLELSSNGKQLILINKNSDWFVTTEDFLSPIPADSNSVMNFINKLTEVTQMYKITEKFSKDSSFGLLADSTFHLKYFYNDTDFSELFFGDYDFSQTGRYVMGGKNTAVYLVNPVFDNYLSTSVQFWAEPYIISKQLYNFSTDSIQRIIIDNFETRKTLLPSNENFRNIVNSIIDLRHGGQAENPVSQKKELEIIIENGNKKDLKLTFYKNQTDYTVHSETDDFTFNYRISNWTYNKYKEAML